MSRSDQAPNLNNDNLDDECETPSRALVPPTLFGTAKDLIYKHTHCAICGSQLHFIQVTDFSKNLTQESAKCPECGIKTQSVTHRLQ